MQEARKVGVTVKEAERKRRMEDQKRISAAVKRALADGRDTFVLDGRLHRKKGTMFLEVEQESENNLCPEP